MSLAKASDYERTDAKPWLLASLAIGIGAFLVLAPLALTLLYPGSLHRSPPRLGAGNFPSPRLQIDPALELAHQRRAEENHLTTYGWVDRERQLVRVPIDRAISLVQQRGLPGWQKP